MTKIITYIKSKGKKQYISYFLQYQILKARERINDDEQCYHVNQFILESAGSYCNFHISFMYHVLCFPVCNFFLYFPYFPFFFTDVKVGAVPSSDSSLFQKGMTISQLNVQVSTAANEERYTLSNILYIAFHNCYSFLSRFFEVGVLKGQTN